MTLPGRELVLRACRDTATFDDPILLAVTELTKLHEFRIADKNDIEPQVDQERGWLIHSIDRWVNQVSPRPHGGAPFHTETVGDVINRLTELFAQSSAAQAGGHSWTYYVLSNRVVQLSCAYQDLIDDVSRGARRLPDGGHWVTRLDPSWRENSPQVPV